MSGDAQPATEAGAQRLRGILLVVAASACFSVLDALIKLLADRYSPFMLSWTRYFFHIVVMGLVFGRSVGLGLVRTRRPMTQFVRGATLAVSALTFFNAVALLPQAEATAILSVAPMLVTVGAVWLLRERAPAGTFWALSLSFAGVLLMLRPGSGLAGWGALLALLAALMSAAYSLLTRSLAASDDTLATLFIGGVVALLCLSFYVPFVWQWPRDLTDLALMFASGACGALGHLMLVRAYSMANASTLAPFTYAHAACALVTGLIFFGAFPDALSLAGMALIVATGVVMALRRRAPRG